MKQSARWLIAAVIILCASIVVHVFSSTFGFVGMMVAAGTGGAAMSMMASGR